MLDWFFYKEAYRPKAERIADIDAQIKKISFSISIAAHCLQFERAREEQKHPHFLELKQLKKQIEGS